MQRNCTCICKLCNCFCFTFLAFSRCSSPQTYNAKRQVEISGITAKCCNFQEGERRAPRETVSARSADSIGNLSTTLLNMILSCINKKKLP